MNRTTRIIRDETDSMDCPKCGKPCGRDSVHNGVCMLYGPWGCSCGWSEDPRYDLSEGQSPVRDGGRIDSRGGFTPDGTKWLEELEDGGPWVDDSGAF